MRFTRNLNGNGISRLRKNHTYKYKPEYIPPPKPEPSNDTLSRMAINKKIIEMLEENKNDIEIELYLREIYPGYVEYIPKMIRHHMSKINEKRSKNTKQEEVGDNR